MAKYHKRINICQISLKECEIFYCWRHWIIIEFSYTISLILDLSSIWYIHANVIGIFVSYLIGIGAILIVYGTGVSNILINTDASSSQIMALEFALENFNDTNSTLLAGPVYSWIFNYVYDKNNVLSDYSMILFDPIKTQDMMLIADPHFMLDIQRGIELQNAYDNSHLIYEINGSVNQINTNIFPFQSVIFTGEGKFIEIKRNNVP